MTAVASTWRHPETDLPKVIIESDYQADPFPPEETTFLIVDQLKPAGATRDPWSNWAPAYEHTLPGVGR
jgi:hypothetical protein